MPISPGARLGSYEVLSPLGAGGMGEVYRARDTKLGREVAIKVLPEEFSHDQGRLARFQREARLLASLNHTNIAHIYGVEDSGETHYIVMELVPGETLAERLSAGPLAVEEALGICAQIAEALEAAHEKGVIHRDLKPANVKVTPDGKVKVLDFGLAKAFAGDAPGTDLSSLPTLNASVSREGVILGTVPYMSPEQAQGKEVDKRTDIWAFGCLFYELLTGRIPFAGESVTEVIAAILKEEPDWKDLPPFTPAKVRDLLGRCLRKDKKRRLHDIADARIEMEEAVTARAAELSGAAAADARTGWRRSIPFALAALVVGAIIASIAVWNLKPAPAPQPVTRTAIPLPPEERLVRLPVPSLSLSPDGAHIAYVATSGGAQQLYLRAMDSLEASPIAGTEGAWDPFFSPDGQWLGFFAGGQMKKVSVSGGATLTLSDASAAPRGAAWGPNGTIVFTPTTNAGLWQVSAAGGTPQELTTLKEGETSHRWPHFLPDGNAVLFTVGTGGNYNDESIVSIAVRRLDTGEQRFLIRGGTYPRYAPTGHLVYYLAGTGTMMAVPFDVARLEVTGSPVPVVEGVLSSALTSGAGQFSFSNQGSLVYVPGAAIGGDLSLVWVDRQGAVEQLGPPPNQYLDPRLSPDGRRLAVRITGDSVDVWVYDLSRQTLTRLTFEGTNQHAIWTPDGERVTFRSIREGQTNPNLFWKLADGSGPAEQLSETNEQVQSPSSWSPDGQLLAFYERSTSELSGGSTNYDIWVLPLEGERKPQPFLQSQFSERDGVFSPDGRWLAYVSNESGRNEIFVQPYPGPGGKWQISTGGGAEPVWSRNRQELFYRNGNQMMAVEVTTEPSFSARTPTMLFEGAFPTTANSRANYDVTPDGQRFVMIQEGGTDSAPTQINVVLNWFEELKRRVPTGN